LKTSSLRSSHLCPTCLYAASSVCLTHGLPSAQTLMFLRKHHTYQASSTKAPCSLYTSLVITSSTCLAEASLWLALTSPSYSQPPMLKLSFLTAAMALFYAFTKKCLRGGVNMRLNMLCAIL
ncbi:hypothetical protein BAE44_0016668, partial [Dichanthelium oligosanthes]